MPANWIHLAVASGLCAATNGLFAKLTTTTTTSFAADIVAALSLSPDSRAVVEIVVRGLYFALNLLFNAMMWGLFTAALAKGSSATTVSVVNTSTNFMATALFGWFVFAEALPPMWWVGASMLVAGSVIISRRDTEEKAREYTALPRHDEELEEQQLVAVDTGSGSGSGYEEDDAGGQKRRRGA